MKLFKEVSFTSYFGWATIALEWFGAIILMIIKKPDMSEPFSQYGHYDSTKLLFGLLFTTASITYYLFSRHLDKYWRYTSIFSIIAGTAFIITGWTPYTPGAGTFVVDLHNVAFVISILFFTTPMLFISYAKKHSAIARLSRVSYTFSLLVVFISLIARATSWGLIYAQLAILIVFHIWLGVINYLLIWRESEHDMSTSI